MQNVGNDVVFIICYLKVTTPSAQFKPLTYPNLTVFCHYRPKKPL